MPFADSNGRMGRLWQTVILSRWHPSFATLPVESLVHQHQAAYYQAIQNSTAQTDCAPFIHFMLSMIRDTLERFVTAQAIAQVTAQADNQVQQLLSVMAAQTYYSTQALMQLLGLMHRESFRKSYLKPALAQGVITMLLPEKPNSPKQKYCKT